MDVNYSQMQHKGMIPIYISIYNKIHLSMQVYINNFQKQYKYTHLQLTTQGKTSFIEKKTEATLKKSLPFYYL